MVLYIITSVLWGMGFDYLDQYVTTDKAKTLTNGEKIFSTILWPLMLIIFLNGFLTKK
tara:strand:- start:4839 stop:5012 length:174 start_codon:yes stop_codon:yes gene_type:complete